MTVKVIIILFLISITQIGYSQVYSINLKVENITKVKGNVLIAIYNSKVSFLEDKISFRKYKETVKDKTMEVSVRNLPKGEYSIALYHDINSNGKMDRNFIGIPSEHYGFSNITSIIFSRPSFDETKFLLKSDTSIVIKLR